MPTPAAVPALLPLSLLEAIRNLDTPVEDGLDATGEVHDALTKISVRSRGAVDPLRFALS